MVELYHYTDRNSYVAIQNEGCIRPSHAVSRGQRGPGGRHGTGVYLTDMNPREHEQDDIARNNFGTGWEKNLPKTDHHIIVDIPDDDPRLQRVGPRKWVFRGEVRRYMFSDSVGGANEDWDPLAAVAIAGTLALAGASMAVGAISAYREKKRAEDEIKRAKEARKAKEREERIKAELRASLEAAGADTSPNFWRDVKEETVPSDFTPSRRDIGADIDEHVSTWTRYLMKGGLVLTASGLIAFRRYPTAVKVSAASLASALFGLCLFSDWCELGNIFDAASRLRNVLREEESSLFRQKKDGPYDGSSFLGRAFSWMAGTSPLSNIDYNVSVSRRSLFGFIKVAAVSLPLADIPSTDRKYYWIGVLGKWYAVTIYHYVTRDNETEIDSES